MIKVERLGNIAQEYTELQEEWARYHKGPEEIYDLSHDELTAYDEWLDKIQARFNDLRTRMQEQLDALQAKNKA